LYHIRPPTPSHWYQCPPSPQRTCSTLLFSHFLEEKNDTFACVRKR
jgi:hypothetical protein